PPRFLGPYVVLVMSGSGQPLPPANLIAEVVNDYAKPIWGPTSTTQFLYTPQQLYPLFGAKELSLDQSVSQGVSILNSALMQQLPPPFGTGTNRVVVGGISQSAIIASLEMRQLAELAPGSAPTASQLGFMLLGDPMNPNGGLFSRFPGLTLPSLGWDLYGATPPNTIYPTDIYSLEYDGFAYFPQYPIDFLSDLNAVAGIAYVHSDYPDLTPTMLSPGYNIQTLPTSPGYTGVTTYHMITYPNLPLLDPVRAIPVIGNPLADLIQPDLTYLVNWGYGNPAYGYSTGPANVPTPFGVLPPVSATTVLPGDLVIGAQHGIGAFMNDVNAETLVLANHLSLSSLTSLGSAATSVGSSLLPAVLTSAQSFSPDSIIQSLESANTSIANFVSNAAAQSYAVLLPTADIVNALVISLPSYDVNLFLNGIEQAINGDPTGGLIYAFGAPVAADLAISTLAGGFELQLLSEAATSIFGDFGRLT
ncbi:MAG: PE-PPE domain-containing protein, partial [Mycobacterium sp.]